MAREADAYGISMYTFSAGASVTVQMPNRAYVVARDLLSISGSSFLAFGASTAPANMIQVPTTALPLRIPGPAPFYASGGGATLNLVVIEYLSQGIGSTQFP